MSVTQSIISKREPPIKKHKAVSCKCATHSFEDSFPVFRSLTLNFLLCFAAMTMTARDFVMQGLNKESDFGIKGYHMARTLTKLDGPLVARIHAGKKKTFVDMAVKEKAFVPPANYNV